MIAALATPGPRLIPGRVAAVLAVHPTYRPDEAAPQSKRRRSMGSRRLGAARIEASGARLRRQSVNLEPQN
jgi:hypothetical protein